MSNLEAFRALCIKVADERDPKKIELLKQRMRILMLEGLESLNEVERTSAIEDQDQCEP